MKERPIIFSGPMVVAILGGWKTQTRRVVQQPRRKDGAKLLPELLQQIGVGAACSYGEPGDRLWVRETFVAPWGLDYKMPGGQPGIFYRADDDRTPESDGRWTPAIHMPRAVCRIVLDVVDVRVQRLQEISERDAIAEGETGTSGYHLLWNELNEKRGFGWDTNPWVWVIDFKRAA